MKNELFVLLADDDQDDCLLFKDALEQLHAPTTLVTVNDGEQLMQFLLDKTNHKPDVLFLDLNMPRKNGFECLAEIKRNKLLQELDVIIFSTSSEQDVVNLLYNNGAKYYISKPSDFVQIKKVVQQAISLVGERQPGQTGKDKFILTGDLSPTN